MGGDEPEQPDGIGVTTLARTETVVEYDHERASTSGPAQ